MKQDQMQASCALLHQHLSQQTRLQALPPELRPSSRSEGYGIQAFLEGYSDKPLYGWKIAATSAAGQAHLGIDGPLAGRMLAERVIPDGGTYPVGSSLMRVAELEFAFKMARSLPPRPQPYTQDEVMAAVGTLHPAIEIPDSRFEEFGKVGAAQLLADNAAADRFVLGPAAKTDWRSLDLAAHQVRAIKNGEAAGEGSGASVLGDPRIALTWIANELSQNGLTLGADQVVTTGTCMKPVPFATGDRIDADFGVLGRVSLMIG